MQTDHLFIFVCLSSGRTNPPPPKKTARYKTENIFGILLENLPSRGRTQAAIQQQQQKYVTTLFDFIEFSQNSEKEKTFKNWWVGPKLINK